MSRSTEERRRPAVAGLGVASGQAADRRPVGLRPLDAGTVARAELPLRLRAVRRHAMKACVPFLLCLVLAACATTASRGAAGGRSPVQRSIVRRPVGAHQPRHCALAVSPAMKHFVDVEIAEQLHAVGYLPGFVQALQTKGQLKLQYDAERTRNAAEAFDVRAGNCLSLVIMTAALAKQIGLVASVSSGLRGRLLESQRRCLFRDRTREPDPRQAANGRRLRAQ